MYILLINKVSRSVSLLVQISALYMSTGICQGDTNNLTEFRTRECLSGFRKIEGECKECIGFVGTNCGLPCVKGFYGEGCRSSCNCSAGQTCNQFVGCFPSVNVGAEGTVESLEFVLAQFSWNLWVVESPLAEIASVYICSSTCVEYTLGFRCNVKGFFEEGCRSSCNCSTGHTCNQFVGCIPSGDRRKVEAGRNTPSGGDRHCIHWPMAVNLTGFQGIVLGLVGYWVRYRMKWMRNHEIPDTETVGHFRRRISCKTTTERKTMERGEERPVHYDDHLLRTKNPNEEMEDVYNHIHIKKVLTVQNSSDEYGVIMKQHKDNLDKSLAV